MTFMAKLLDGVAVEWKAHDQGTAGSAPSIPPVLSTATGDNRRTAWKQTALARNPT